MRNRLASLPNCQGRHAHPLRAKPQLDSTRQQSLPDLPKLLFLEQKLTCIPPPLLHRHRTQCQLQPSDTVKSKEEHVAVYNNAHPHYTLQRADLTSFQSSRLLSVAVPNTKPTYTMIFSRTSFTGVAFLVVVSASTALCSQPGLHHLALLFLRMELKNENILSWDIFLSRSFPCVLRWRSLLKPVWLA